MYFYLDILQRRGQFGLLWLAAFDHEEFTKRRTVASVRIYDVGKCCDDILRYAIEGRDNCPRMNLYVTSTLVFGLCKVFKKKSALIFDDAARVFVRWGEVARLQRVLDSKQLKHFKHLEMKDINELRVTRPIAEPMQPPKKRRKRVENEYDLPVLTHEELANLLGQADRIHVADPAEITMRDAESRIPMDVLPEEFGGIESMLPELQDILNGEQPSKVPAASTAALPEETPMDMPSEMLAAQMKPLKAVPELLKEQELQQSLDQAPERPSDVAMEQSLGAAAEQAMVTAHDKPLEVTLEQAHATEQPSETAKEEALQIAPEKPPQSESGVKRLQQKTQTAKAPRATQYGKHSSLKKDEVIYHNYRKPKDQTLLHLKAMKEGRWGKQEHKKSQTDSPVSHVLLDFPVPDEPALDAPYLHQKLLPLIQVQRLEIEVRRSLMRRSQSETQNNSISVSIGSPTPVAERRSQRGVSPKSPTFQVMEVPESLDTIPEVIPQVEDGEFSVQSLPQNLTTVLEEEVVTKRRRKEQVSPTELLKSTPTGLKLEGHLMLIIKGAIAEHDGAVTFAMMAPPVSTTKLRAACLFTSLLSLEARKLVKTQQNEPFGDIFITLN